MKHFFITCILFLMLSGCRNLDRCETRCSPDFFTNVDYSDTSDISKTFKLQRPIKLNNKCGYKHEFQFWQSFIVNDSQSQELPWRGRLFYTSKAIYFELDSGNVFKYFDFGMNVGDSEEINAIVSNYSEYLKRKVDLTKRYQLHLESKFCDKNLNDTIYKFRFKNINVLFNQTDLVFYISIQHGIIGICHSTLLGSGIEEIFSSIGNIYDNTDKQYVRQKSNGNIL